LPYKIALLIDAENVSYRDLPRFLEAVERQGPLGLKAIYGDWKRPNLQKWHELAQAENFKIRHQTSNPNVKNSSDMKLIMDAMEVLYRTPFRVFCLVSNDADYVPLCEKIRRAGGYVIGMGYRNAAEALIRACDMFIFIQSVEADDPLYTKPDDSAEFVQSSPPASRPMTRNSSTHAPASPPAKPAPTAPAPQPTKSVTKPAPATPAKPVTKPVPTAPAPQPAKSVTKPAPATPAKPVTKPAPATPAKPVTKTTPATPAPQPAKPAPPPAKAIPLVKPAPPTPPIAPAPQPTPVLEAAAAPPQAELTPPPPPEPPAELLRLLLSAFSQTPRDAQGWASLSALGNILSQLQPNFDTSQYGHANLSKLLQSLSDMVELRDKDGTRHVRLLRPSTGQLPDLLSLMLRAFNQSPRDAQGWVSLSALGTTLYQLQPSFDTSRYGHANLSKLLQSLSDMVELRDKDGARQARLRPSRDELPDLIRRAFAEVKFKTQGWVDLAALGSTLSQIKQGFKTSDYGHSTLSKLLQSLPDLVEVKDIGGGIKMTRLKDA